MDINYSGQLRETLTIIESNSDFLSISSDIFDFAASDQRQYPRVSDFVDEFDKNPDQFRAWLSGLASYLRLARFRNVPMEVVVPSRSSDRSNRQHKFPQYHIMVKQAYRSSLHVNIPGRDNGVRHRMRCSLVRPRNYPRDHSPHLPNHPSSRSQRMFREHHIRGRSQRAHAIVIYQPTSRTPCKTRNRAGRVGPCNCPDGQHSNEAR
mmetsp:Transcript_7781/g.13764  ORF Transcript_7781/g.13764 Transcript_7781/m.13764 type:complete len:207 (-) Transcript_7781:1304-1924(-)